MKITLDVIINKLEFTEETISELEDTEVKFSQTKEKERIKDKYEQSISELRQFQAMIKAVIIPNLRKNINSQI